MADLEEKGNPDMGCAWLKHVSALVVIGIGLAWYWVGTKNPAHESACWMGVLISFVGLAGWYNAMWATSKK